MMFWYDHHMSGWGWFGASLGMIVFWGLIITAFVLLLRAFDRPQPTGPHRAPWAPPTQASPEQLLAERFARGEIDEEEYRRRLQVLRAEGANLTKH
ncbi:SHOCT domain-containing protein [Streptomyces sp. NBC_00005]|uniref:SHOCT domain-containing protein n=1 Tax=Streptomyces sp. NBC_00005 TaxID=2903609 RepID=UPI003251BC88